MQGTLDFFKSHWLKLVLLFLPLVGAMVGVHFVVQKGPADQPPSVIIVIPDDSGDAGFLAKGAAAPGRDFHPRLRPLLRAHMAVALADRDKISLPEAFRKVMSVSREHLDSALSTAAEKQGVYGQLGDGQLLQKLLDFLASPQGQALIKLLLSLLMFADAHDVQPALPMDPCGPIRVAQVPYPLAWEPPCLALAV
jgi:hypothetical protein